MTAEINLQLQSFIIGMFYLLSACGFFVGLKFLSSPKTARLGNLLAAGAMIIAIITTLFRSHPEKIIQIFVVIGAGSILGIISARRVKMTAMPQMVAIFNGFGGLASVLVSMSESLRLFYDDSILASSLFSVTAWFSVFVGAVTLSGSIIAFLKLQGIISARPVLFMGQRLTSALLFLAIVAALYFLLKSPENMNIFLALTMGASLLGILLVIPIGGADMPVVISLLNSYSGLAALAAGFVVNSQILIISGALVGASGVILTRLMCKAMNRSLANVIFGAFGDIEVGSGDDSKPMREFSPIDAAVLLKNASKVIIIPGYGLAVAQAQRNLRELCDELKTYGVKVAYAIHPVAGRMPGHMNVLLAEADVPYEELFDLDEINADFETADVAMVIGANDVVNPAARNNKHSPLYGMPILNADKAKTVIVMKRGKGRGFAGVENPLFTMDKTGVVFGDAKKSLTKVLESLKEL